MVSKVTIVVVLAFVATSFADPVPPRGAILSSIIRKALESLRPNLKDLVIPSQSVDVKDPKMNLTASLDDGLVEKLEKFRICRLDTTLVPLSVTNLTIVLDEVKITGRYALDGRVAFPGASGIIPVDGKGDAKIELKGVFATIAGKFILSGKKVQIAPKGLYGFDLYVKESKFNLENFCGGGDKGEKLNKFLSEAFPELVNKVKQPLFDKYRDPLIKIINDFLSEMSFDVPEAEE